MTKIRMLKTLPGVVAGEVYPRTFREGEEYEINDSLVLGFMEQGGCEIVDQDEAGTPSESVSTADTRETKVTGPTETKPSKPLEKMTKAELAEHARVTHGLELDPEAMKAKDMIAAIEAKATA